MERVLKSHTVCESCEGSIVRIGRWKCPGVPEKEFVKSIPVSWVAGRHKSFLAGDAFYLHHFELRDEADEQLSKATIELDACKAKTREAENSVQFSIERVLESHEACASPPENDRPQESDWKPTVVASK